MFSVYCSCTRPIPKKDTIRNWLNRVIVSPTHSRHGNSDRFFPRPIDVVKRRVYWKHIWIRRFWRSATPFFSCRISVINFRKSGFRHSRRTRVINKLKLNGKKSRWPLHAEFKCDIKISFLLSLHYVKSVINAPRCEKERQRNPLKRTGTLLRFVSRGVTDISQYINKNIISWSHKKILVIMTRDRVFIYFMVNLNIFELIDYHFFFFKAYVKIILNTGGVTWDRTFGSRRTFGYRGIFLLKELSILRLFKPSLNFIGNF